jgi:Lyzozyme M1 (1,4-beta-N-acetylmuramidase)
MKKYLSIILSLLFLLFSSNVDARKRKHHHRRITKKHIRIVERIPVAPRIVEGICGIDVSHYQGSIDWDRVSCYENNPIKFVYVKATEGSTIKDDYYQRNISLAKGKGLLVGSYHYFTSKSTAEEQFENFKQTAEKEHQDLIPVVDIEECKYWTPDVFHKNLQVFLNEIEAYYGKKPVIYTFSAFYNSYLIDRYKNYKIFIAQYGDGNPELKDGNSWHIWQFTRKGKVEGIHGNVDVNAINPGCDHNEILLNGKPNANESVEKKELVPNPVPVPVS